MREMNASACDALASGVRWDSPALIGSLVILGLIDAMVVGGNLLVIVAVFVSSKLRASVTNLFIASLAVADLLLGIAVLPFSAAWEVFDEVWLFGDVWCSVWLAVDVWMCTASILNLCAISLDRYVAVTRPVSYPSIMSCGRAKMLIAGVWVLSFLICFPPLVGWNDHRENATAAGETAEAAEKAAASPLPPVTTLNALDIPLTSAEASTQPPPFSLDDSEEDAAWLEQSSYSHVLLQHHHMRHQKSLRLGRGESPGVSVINSQEEPPPTSRESNWSSLVNASMPPLRLLQRAPSISAVSSETSSGSVASSPVVTPSPSELISCPWVCELTNDAGYVVYSALGSFYIPMLVMLFFYWRIYRAAVRTTKAINQGFRTTKGSKVLGVGFGSGSSGGGGGGGGGGGSFGGGCSRFDEHRLTLRIHRGRGSVMHHGSSQGNWGGSSNNCNYSTASGATASSDGSPPASSPRRLVRSRTQDRIRINVTYQPEAGEGGGGGADGGGVGPQPGRRGGSCRSVGGRGATAAALASAASSAAGTALYSVHYAGGPGANSGSSPTGGGAGGGGSGGGSRPDYAQRQEAGSRRSSSRFEGGHQHLLRVSSTSSNNSNPNSAALQRTQSARQRGSSGGESELMVPGRGQGGSVSPGSSPTTYESISVSSATAGGEGSGSPGSGFGMSSCSVKRRQQQQQRNNQQTQQQQQQHVSRMGKRNIKAQVKRFRMETKAAKTLGIIVGGFIVCWLPFFTMYLVRAFCEDCIPPLVFSVLFWLGYCNSAINPCIYALFSKDFRFAFKRIICKCFCTGRRGCRGGWNDGPGGVEAGGAFGGGGGGSWGSFRRRSNRQSGQQQQQQQPGVPAGQQRRLWGRKKTRSPPAWLLASSWARRTSGGPNIEDCEGNGGNSLGEDSEERAGSGSGGAGGTGGGGGVLAPPNGTSRNHNGNVEVIVTSDSR